MVYSMDFLHPSISPGVPCELPSSIDMHSLLNAAIPRGVGGRQSERTSNGRMGILLTAEGGVLPSDLYFEEASRVAFFKDVAGSAK